MKKIKFGLIFIMAAALFAGAPSSSFSVPEEVEGERLPLGVRATIETSLESVYYDVNLFGIPFEGTLYPGEPFVVDIPFLIHVEVEILDIDFWDFTVSWSLTFRGVLISEGVNSFGHGDIKLFYNQLEPTQQIWYYDFNVFGLNWPGMVGLWVYSRIPDSTGFISQTATRWTGDTDISFSFPDFIFVEGTVTEFGTSSNTFEYNIYDLYKSYEGVQTFPFGFVTLAYDLPSWW